MLCEMSGCHDAATHTADFWQITESLEICESCAIYWSEQTEEKPKIKKLNEGKTEMKKYKVQRKASQWIEITVEADNLENALEIADKEFADANFIDADGGFEIDEEEFWVETHDGLVFTNTHAPEELSKH